ncbi:MAG: HAMP domain-containing protein [Gammaproteobacteria bacterium]|nr:HAMP domain-containing protein [Gammaproteobacteria bacterium]
MISDRLDPNGLAMRKVMTEIIDSAYQDKDTEATYFAARVQEQLLLGRLYVSKYLNTHHRTDFDRALSEMETNVNKTQDALNVALENPHRRALFEQFMRTHGEYVVAMKDIFQTTEKRDDLIQGTLDRIGPVVAQHTENVMLSAKADQDTLGPQVQAATESRIVFIGGLSGGAILLSVLLAWIISRLIRQPLQQAAAVSNQIAQGDLTVVIPAGSQNEIGQLLQAMQIMKDKLCDIVNQVNMRTDTVSSAAREIAQGSTDLSQRTEQQASSLEETAASMEELTATVKNSAENAAQANQLAIQARTQAEQGGDVVTRTTEAMSAINQSSRQIADIIGVIDEIAFQTNLLALNAAVEAARAGEQGRGFAVVAGEVRKLAQRSADSAKDIKALIKSSVGKVEEGSYLVDECGKTLREIVTAAKRVNSIVAELATASREQSEGIEQVNQAITQLDRVTQQNAALVEQTAAASHSMGDQAQTLQQLMAFFKLDHTAILTAANSNIATSEVAEWTASTQPEQRSATQLRTAPAPFVAKAVSGHKRQPLKVVSAKDDWETF